AARAGALFVRPGEGRCELVHFERLAAPGRVLASSGRRAPIAGALGMIVLPCGALEAAAVMAGRSLERRFRGVLGLAIEGELPAWADGHDVACALIAALGPGAAPESVAELSGPGIASLGVLSRVAIAREIERLGVGSSLFPSDDRTRGYLAACGRDADWRRLDPGELTGCERVRSLDLATLEPMTIGLDRDAVPRPVREDRGLAVGAILVGSAAGASDLARLARGLESAGAAGGTSISIAPGSRRVRESAEATGVLSRLRERGAEIIEGGVPPTPATLGLAYGALASDIPAGRTQWRSASVATCVMAAGTGVLGDPRDLEASGLGEEPEIPHPPGEALRVQPPDPEAGETPAGFPLGLDLVGPLRGVVLIRLGDRVTSEQVLPWGARVRPLVGDFRALSEFALASLAPSFPARARAAGGGFVVAGASFGEGEPWDTAALVLVELGVRAVLADSIARGFARLIALAGILPLEWAGSGEGARVREGDELEFPGAPETFIAGRPLVARNLTRGTQYTLRHSLSGRDVERLRRGGLLADIAAR
ncbi:MAG TPA: aconitase family protein, partial [Candidatus Udaeobacter sp.]|nr:aconitase family protein [Candidatus Udaeobacter sp.]